TRFVITSGSIADENKKQLDYVETQTDPETRTLQINFPPNQTNMEITGTVIVPEFPLSEILLTVSFSSMLVFYGIKLRKEYIYFFNTSSVMSCYTDPCLQTST